MLNISKAFSSFSVNDIQKAREFYGKTLGLELSNGPEGTLVVPLSGGTKALMYPKPNDQPHLHGPEFSRRQRRQSCR
jgi:catechol 2,3-dioxygenase-like lactoylglutathione lyase family enzyme